MENSRDFLSLLHSIRSRDPQAAQTSGFNDLLSVIQQDCRKSNGALPTTDPVELLQANSLPLNLHLHTCSTQHDAAETIVALAMQTTAEFTDQVEVIMHDHPDIHRLQLASRLQEKHIPCHCTEENRRDTRLKTMESSIGITVADFGVAESGTIVQMTAAGRPRSTSLVPSVHIALLRKERLLLTLSQLYRKLSPDTLPNSFVFISGPSKTADIEAHMVHGAHGPREMHLILVDNMEATG